MRSGWQGNVALQKRVLAADADARVIVHAEVVEAEDRIDTAAEWAAMDAPSTAFEVLEDGGIRLLGTGDEYVAHGGDSESDATDETLTDLPDVPTADAPAAVCEVHWSGVGVSDVEVYQIVARLNARADSEEAQEVARWFCQLFRIHRLDTSVVDSDGTVELEPLGPIAEAVPGGAGPEDVTFDFAARAGSPVRLGAGPRDRAQPITVVRIWGLTADGAPAGNTGWLAEPTEPPVDGDGEVGANLYGYLYVPLETGAESQGGGSAYVRQSAAAVPRIEIHGRAYTEETATFTGAPLDLGASPTSPVRFIAAGERPGDSALKFEVRNDADDAWVEFQDGALAASLAGVTDRQTYQVRVTLTPSTEGHATPVVRTIGVRAVETHDLDGLATVEGPTYAVDPVTHRAEIPEATIRVARDGERDFRDTITRILSEHHVGSVELVCYLGHPSLPREAWLHLDTFVIDDYDTTGPEVVITAVSPLGLLAVTIPAYDDATDERTPALFENDTLTEAWGELLDAHIALPDRYIGQPPDDATTVRRKLKEARGKDALDGIAFLADGANIASQGRVKFVRMAAEDRGAPVVSLAAEEVRALSVTPGLRARIEEFFVPYEWDEETGTFRREVRAFSEAAVVGRLGRTFIEAPQRLDDEIAKWIATEEHAEAIGARVIRRCGTGLTLWTVRSQYPNPHVEPGDVVAIETDRFVAADPLEETPRPIRGRVWGLGVVQSVAGLLGYELTVWIQSYAQITPSTSLIDRVGFTPAAAMGVAVRLDVDSSGVGNTTVSVGAGIRSFYALGVVGREPTRAEILASGRLIEVSGPVTTVAGLVSGGVGDTLHAAVIGFSGTDGTGQESEIARDRATVVAKPHASPPRFTVTPTHGIGSAGLLAILAEDADDTMRPYGGESLVRFTRLDTGASHEVATPTHIGVPFPQYGSPAYTSPYGFRVRVQAVWRRAEDDYQTLELGTFEIVDDGVPRVGAPIIRWGFNGVQAVPGVDDDVAKIKWIARRGQPFPENADTLAEVLALGTEVASSEFDGNQVIISTGDDNPEVGGSYWMALVGLDAEGTPGPLVTGGGTRTTAVAGPRFEPTHELLRARYQAALGVPATAPMVLGGGVGVQSMWFRFRTDQAVTEADISGAFLVRRPKEHTSYGALDFEVVDENGTVHWSGDGDVIISVTVATGDVRRFLVRATGVFGASVNTSRLQRFHEFGVECFALDLELPGSADVLYGGAWFGDDMLGEEAPTVFVAAEFPGPNFAGDIAALPEWGSFHNVAFASVVELRHVFPHVPLSEIGIRPGDHVEAAMEFRWQSNGRWSTPWDVGLQLLYTDGPGNTVAIKSVIVRGSDVQEETGGWFDSPIVLTVPPHVVPEGAVWVRVRPGKDLDVPDGEQETSLVVYAGNCRFRVRAQPSTSLPPTPGLTAYEQALLAGASAGSATQAQEAAKHGATTNSSGAPVIASVVMTPDGLTTAVDANGVALDTHNVGERTATEVNEDIEAAAEAAQQALSDASTAQEAAEAAQGAAEAAQGDATAALTALGNIASDDVLTPGEKSPLIKEVAVLQAEEAGIVAQAEDYGITTETSAYTGALDALESHLGGLTTPVAWNDLSGNTEITGSTFRSTFEAVYAARQALLNAIAAAAKVLADDAQEDANQALADALAAQTAADTKARVYTVATTGELPTPTDTGKHYAHVTSTRRILLWDGDSWEDVTETTLGTRVEASVVGAAAGSAAQAQEAAKHGATTNSSGAPVIAAVIMTPDGLTTALDANGTALAIVGQGGLATKSVVKLGTEVTLANGTTTVGESDLLATFNKLAEANIASFAENAAIPSAYIKDLAASKLTAGLIQAIIGIGVGNIELDGLNDVIRVVDDQGSPVTRVEIGKLGEGDEDWGIAVYNSAGQVAFNADGLGASGKVGDQRTADQVNKALNAQKLLTGSKVKQPTPGEPWYPGYTGEDGGLGAQGPDYWWHAVWVPFVLVEDQTIDAVTFQAQIEINHGTFDGWQLLVASNLWFNGQPWPDTILYASGVETNANVQTLTGIGYQVPGGERLWLGLLFMGDASNIDDSMRLECWSPANSEAFHPSGNWWTSIWPGVLSMAAMTISRNPASGPYAVDDQVGRSEMLGWGAAPWFEVEFEE